MIRRPRVLGSSSLQVAARTFSFIFRRSRKLVFPRSTKDRRSNTKRLPIAARLRPKTSRFNAKRAVSNGALSDAIREWGFREKSQQKKTEFIRQEWAPLLHAFELARNALVQSSVTHFSTVMTSGGCR